MSGQRVLQLLSGVPTGVAAAQTSSGAGSAGQIVALNAQGQIDNSMLSSILGRKGQAVLNFGFNSIDTSVDVTGQTGIVAGCAPRASLLIASTAQHSSDEHLVEQIDIRAGNIVAGVGFTIYGRSASHSPLYGTYNVAWSWD